jgi:cyclin B
MNTTFDHRGSIPMSLGNMSKINPFNQKRNITITNNPSNKRKYKIPISNREFGKEINISTNLTTSNNQEINNNRKSLGIPIDKNNNKKNFQKILIKKNKKESSNSIHKKPNSLSGKCCTNNNSKNKAKKGSNKIHSKNKSQRNILSTNHIISINDDIIMKDENTNPNIIMPKVHSTNRSNSINTISTVNNNDKNGLIDEDVDMKIENNNMSEIKVKKRVNVQNVDEYFNDICVEIFNKEDKYLPDPQYMSKQSDINHRMRAILIDWLIDVHLKYKLIPQTMYIAVNLIDRYLSKHETTRAKLQLVGITAMFIACKYEEIYPPELKDFVYITDGACVKSDVINMEYRMLKSLEFNITFPTQWSILEIYRRKLDLNEKTFKLAWFLMELCLIDYKTLKFKMSTLAASAILIASKTLGIYRNNWLSKNIGVEEKSLEECCKEMYDFYVYNSTHNLQAIRRKFSSSKYDEVAKIKIC